MKCLKLILCLLLSFCSLVLDAQKNLSEILSQEKKFEEIVQEANDYFEKESLQKKVPNSDDYQEQDGDYARFKRWEYFWKHHQRENGYLGDPNLYRQQAKVQLRGNNPFAAVQWKNFGLPKNLGAQVGPGRTTGIDFHPTDPNTFYVSTAYGGIWKTEDKGRNYVPIGDNLPTLAVAAVVIDKDEPNTIYAATGDPTWFGYPSLGIFKSSDDGKNWEVTAVKFRIGNGIKVYALVANPDKPKEMYLASDAGLYHTKDGFKTIDIIDSTPTHDVKFKPGDPSTIYYTADSKFWLSTDGGENFRFTGSVSNNQRLRVAVTSRDPELVYFSDNELLYQSRNSGASFTTARDIEELDHRNLGYIHLSPTTPHVLYGGFVNTWKSIDNGQNWAQITCLSMGEEVHVDNHFAAYNPLDSGYIYFCNDGGLYRFRENECYDCGDCFPEYEDLSAGLFISQYYDISVSQQQNSLVSGGTQDGGSYFKNANNRWQFYAGTGDGMVGTIDPNDDKYQYWSFQNGRINRTEPEQSSCISCNIPNDEHGNGAWITPFVLDPSKPANIFAGYSKIYRSLDRGNTWKEISRPLTNNRLYDEIAIAPSDNRYAYASSGSSFFQTSNAYNENRPTWRQKVLPWGGTISSIEVHPTERATVYVTKSGYRNDQKVFKSTDSGDTWTNITGSIPNVPAMVIKAVRDPNYEEALFVGTGAGVFYKNQDMEDWVEYGQLPHTLVTDIEFQYQSQNIRIGTYGRSLFEAALPLSPCLFSNGLDSDQDGICDAFDICPNGDDLIDLDNDLAPDACETYCLAQSSLVNVTDKSIRNVKLHTFDHASTASGYSDFRDIETDLIIGNEYELSIQIEKAVVVDRAYAWIDYNQNKEFEPWEAIEMSNYNSEEISVGSLLVPQDAIPGKTTMRVRNILSIRPVADPCNNYVGEVEDYTVNINAIATNTLNNLAESTTFKVFPNPGQDELHILLEQEPMQGPVYLEIVDFSGRTLLGRRYTPNQLGTRLSLSTLDLVSGVYFIKIQNHQQQWVRKWVKQ